MDNYVFKLAAVENGVLWKRIEKTVLRNFESFDNLQVIEIGAGSGKYSALMAKRGAEVVLLDYSESGLNRARKFFRANGLSAGFLKQNALSLPADLVGKFDISMSFGLTEHFKGGERIAINKAHFDLLREGGMTFISVPNKFNLSYIMSKFVSGSTRRWEVGEEYPYTRKELGEIFQEIGFKECSFLGNSIFGYFSFNDLAYRIIIKRLFKLETDITFDNVGTVFDQYLSYALLVYGKKRLQKIT